MLCKTSNVLHAMCHMHTQPGSQCSTRSCTEFRKLAKLFKRVTLCLITSQKIEEVTDCVKNIYKLPARKEENFKQSQGKLTKKSFTANKTPESF